MKKINIRSIIAFAAVLCFSTALLTGCSKQKTCRCSVLSETRGSTVRIIKIESGSCDDINVYSYHDPQDNRINDTLLCTDYEFDIDR